MRRVIFILMVVYCVDAAVAAPVDDVRGRAEAGQTGAMIVMASWAEQGGPVPQSAEEAARWLRMSAEKGSAMGMFLLGAESHDDGEAFTWYKKAAEAGLPAAQFMTGEAYEQGRGVGRDAAEAEKWYQRAAEQKWAPAYAELKGDEWLERAALHGNAEGAWRLFAIHGRNSNAETALSWLYLAANEKPEARETLNKLERSVDERILDVARERSRGYRDEIGRNQEAFADRVVEDFRKYGGFTDEDVKMLDREAMKKLAMGNAMPAAWWAVVSRDVAGSQSVTTAPVASTWYQRGIRAWHGAGGVAKDPVEGLAYLYAAAAGKDADAVAKLPEVEAHADLAVRLAAKARCRVIVDASGK